ESWTHGDERVTQLVARISRHGPLLRERVQPRPAVRKIRECVDVLNNALFLVVGLFNEEAIVLNGLGLGRNLCDRKEARGEQQQGEQSNSRHKRGGRSVSETEDQIVIL